MRKPRDKTRAPRSRRGQREGTLLSREDIAALIEQFSHPEERCTVDDWPAVARAFLKTARIRGLAIPPWLAMEAGYGAPPPPLRLVHGGTRDADVVTDNATTSSPAKASSTPRRARLREATEDEMGEAMIITGMGPEAYGRAQNRKRAEEEARGMASSDESSKLPERSGITLPEATAATERASSSNAPTSTRSSSENDLHIDPDDQAWFEANCTDRTDEGGAMIIGGKHVEAMRRSSKKDDPDSSGS